VRQTTALGLFNFEQPAPLLRAAGLAVCQRQVAGGDATASLCWPFRVL